MQRRRRLILLVLALSTTTAAATSPAANAQSPSQCTASFHVLHDDHIGSLPVVLGPNVSCDVAEGLFSQFLKRPSGKLGGGWTVLPDGGEFVHRSTSDGFRIKSLHGPPGSA